MKIDPKLKLEKISGVKDVRVHIRDPHLDVENECLVATDGHKLIRIPVEVSTADTSGPVPLDAIKDARKRKLESAEIVCNGDATLVDPTSGKHLAHYDRVDYGNFPDYERVLPDDSEKPIASVHLNARYLLELAQALSVRRGEEPVVRLDIFDDSSAGISRPVRVVSEKEPDRVGLVMPCRK